MMIDSMKIRSRILYNKSEDHYEGFVVFGSDLEVGEDNNSEKSATKALVLMLVGLKGRCKFRS